MTRTIQILCSDPVQYYSYSLKVDPQKTYSLSSIERPLLLTAYCSPSRFLAMGLHVIILLHEFYYFSKPVICPTYLILFELVTVLFVEENKSRSSSISSFLHPIISTSVNPVRVSFKILHCLLLQILEIHYQGVLLIERLIPYCS
jgi:hypothetical protein